MADQSDGDILKIVASGQPFAPSARRENLVTEVLKGHLAQRGSSPTDSSAYQGSLFYGRVDVKNDSGGDLGEFEVLGISGVGITHADNAPSFKSIVIFTGTTPTTTDHAGKFVITAEPIASGKIGKAFAQGVFPAQVNIVTVGDKWCDVKDSDATQLQSGASGSAQILYAPASTGKQWCLIRVGSTGAPAVEIARVTSAATATGTYNAVILDRPTTDTPAGSDLAASDIGTAGEAILLENVREEGAGTHDLTDSGSDDKDCIAVYRRTNDNGVRVFATDKIQIDCDDAEVALDGAV